VITAAGGLFKGGDAGRRAFEQFERMLTERLRVPAERPDMREAGARKRNRKT